MLLIIVTNDEPGFFFVKAHACYYHFLFHWRITIHAEARWPSGRAPEREVGDSILTQVAVLLS